jgi:hypothetical protein
MAYEAWQAGLDMKIFSDEIKVEDLEPIACKDSMRFPYPPLEYWCLIRWEDHCESRPPLLTNEGHSPQRRFSKSVVSFSMIPILSLKKATRAWHRKRPRQIYDHQKLHPSVRLRMQAFPEIPFAYLPDSWVNRPGTQYGWTEVIGLLQIEEENMKEESSSDKVLSTPPQPQQEGDCGTGIFDIQPDFQPDFTIC